MKTRNHARNVFWLILFFALVAAGVWTARALWLGIRSQSWPAAPGVVVAAAYREDPVQRSPRQSAGPAESLHDAQIHYSYSVGSVPYESTRVSFAVITGSRRLAMERMTRYAPGTAVTVHYDPADPRVSVLETPVAWMEWLWPSVFFAGALGCLVAARAGGCRRDAPAGVSNGPGNR